MTSQSRVGTVSWEILWKPIMVLLQNYFRNIHFEKLKFSMPLSHFCNCNYTGARGRMGGIQPSVALVLARSWSRRGYWFMWDVVRPTQKNRWRFLYCGFKAPSLIGVISLDKNVGECAHGSGWVIVKNERRLLFWGGRVGSVNCGKVSQSKIANQGKAPLCSVWVAPLRALSP